MRRRLRFPLRAALVGLAALPLAWGPSIASGAAAGGIVADPALATGIARQVNDVRAQRGKQGLRFSSALMRAARDHAASMGRNGYFSHSSRTGASESRRLSGYYAGRVAEALFWESGRATVDDVLERWLHSAAHRRVILGADGREIGVAVVYVEHAGGVFGGRDVTIVVTDVGAPA